MSIQQLIVLVGPTAVGKTNVSLSIAESMKCEILSADSRQFYTDLKIGTAAPRESELERVAHHFVGFLSPSTYYNASAFEADVLNLITSQDYHHPLALLTGGSMMYIDAITKGIDIMPDVDEEVRGCLYKMHEEEGLEPLRMQLKRLDPDYYLEADLKNPVRVIHALEICLTTGRPFSSFRKRKNKKRTFDIIKIGLERDRDELYTRINVRVKNMIDQGLVEEVRSLQQYRTYNALNTVGYKEIFEYLDGNYSLDRAIELIQRNSRRYAKKQLTWFKKDKEITWFHPDDYTKIKGFISDSCQSC